MNTIFPSGSTAMSSIQTNFRRFLEDQRRRHASKAISFIKMTAHALSTLVDGSYQLPRSLANLSNHKLRVYLPVSRRISPYGNCWPNDSRSALSFRPGYAVGTGGSKSTRTYCVKSATDN